MFKTLTFLLFSQLAVGGAWSVGLVPDQAGRSFFRFCGAACVVLLAAAILLAGDLSGAARTAFVTALALLVLFVVLVSADRRRVARPVLWGAGLAGAAGLAISGAASPPPDWPGWVAPASAVYRLSGALFLGSVIFAMTLGHWYLVVPRLAIGPLRNLTILMILATAIKTILLAAVLFLGAGSGNDAVSEVVAGFGRLQGLYFWARCLFGLVGPIVICYMTWETVKLNATQSATGLLYVATILVLIGETLSLFIYHTTRLPV